MATDLKIVGQNIRFFRRSRNWTLLELASKIGIKEGPLGRIERGENLPSATVLYKLSNTLKISMDSLFAREPCHASVKGIGLNDVCFISIDSEISLPPKFFLKACRDIRTAYHTLEDICQAQKQAYLPLSIPFSATYQGMDQLAVCVRQYLKVGDAVVFDYFELFENFGLRIILFPFQRNAAKLNSISFYEPNFNNAFFFVDSKQNSEKQIFSLAYELGKILVSNQIKLQNEFFPLENKTIKGTIRPINATRAAKRFAATFLMPETAVRKTVSQLGIQKKGWSWELLLRIKHRFGVSAESFLYRLKELGLIANETADVLTAKITDFYEATNFHEPDSTRRCLTPNGRFFDLLLTAKTIKKAEGEVKEIMQLHRRFKIVQK